MEIKSDIQLKGTAWNKAIKELDSIFSTRTNYSIFMLSLAIGIMYDKRIAKPKENGEDISSVPRNVINNNDNGKLDFFFQAAILSTTTEAIDEDTRLELSFGDKTDFNKVSFLLEFANYGVEKLCEAIGSTPLESMDNIKDFLISTVEGRNYEIEKLPLDDLNISFDEFDD